MTFGAAVSPFGIAWLSLRNFLWWLFFVANVIPLQSCGPSQTQRVCSPKGLLKLSRPFKPPSPLRFQPQVCEKFAQCTCCNASHLAAIQRVVLSLVADPEFSEPCRTFTVSLYCSTCSPQFGVQPGPTFCPNSCETWYEACRNDFYQYEELTKTISPCSSNAKRSPLLCAKLSEFADSGEKLCQLAGLRPGPGILEDPLTPCLDPFAPPDNSVCAAVNDAVVVVQPGNTLRSALAYGTVAFAFGGLVYQVLPIVLWFMSRVRQKHAVAGVEGKVASAEQGTKKGRETAQGAAAQRRADLQQARREKKQ